MGLTREQFKNNFSLFSYFFIAVIIFGFLNFTKETIELRILLFLFISCGIAYLLYNQKKEKEKEEKLLDQGDQKLFNDVNANYFKNDQFYFDFFRKNYFLKDLNIYTWREVIKHCDNYIKIVKLMDSEIKNKPQLLDMAKMEKNHILNLFSSFIVGVKPGTSNLNNKDDDIVVLTRERDILKNELEYHYGELMKKALILWNDNKNSMNRPINSEDVLDYNPNLNYHMDLY